MPVKLILRYHIRTDWFIKKVKCPVHILSGIKDRLIPYKQSIMLQQINPHNITLHPIKGAHHNNLPEFADYHNLLYDILHETDLSVEVLAA